MIDSSSSTSLSRTLGTSFLSFHGWLRDRSSTIFFVVFHFFFFFQAEDGIRDHCVTGVQTCALPISRLLAAFARRLDPKISFIPASGERRGLAARLPLELRDTAAGRLAHLAVAVIRQPLQRTQGRRGGREPQRLDRCHPQLARFPPEKPAGRLPPPDDPPYRVRASDPAQGEDQLPHHR